MENWLKLLRDANKSAILDGNKKKVLYKFGDGREMAEEYNLDTQVVTRRAWKKKKQLGLGGEPEWDVEVGDPSLPTNVFDQCIQESSTQPVMSTRITKSCLEWRIRNLPYPVTEYNVIADTEQRCITVRTNNKKFFKKITAPDLNRLQLPIDQDRIAVTHKFNTLIISYKKPAEMVTFEKLLLEDVNKIECEKENPLQCPTS